MLKPALAIGALAVAVALASASASDAAELRVKMQNQGAQGVMVFEPATARLKVGDTLRFVPTDPGHNVESIREIAPPGAEPVKGAIGKEVVVKLAKPGVYGFKCVPHWAMGMVFVAKVGDGKLTPAAETAAASSAPPMARKRLAAAFAAIR
jgi:pseudoazurin